MNYEIYKLQIKVYKYYYFKNKLYKKLKVYITIKYGCIINFYLE